MITLRPGRESLLIISLKLVEGCWLFFFFGGFWPLWMYTRLVSVLVTRPDTLHEVTDFQVLGGDRGLLWASPDYNFLSTQAGRSRQGPAVGIP